MKKQHILLSAIVISLLLLQLTFAAPPRYEVIDLGTLGGRGSMAYSINGSGLIVGWSRNSSSHGGATLFDSTGNGKNIALGTLGGQWSAAYSINDMGQIVGWGYNSSGGRRATLFDPTEAGNNTNLGTFGGSWSEAWSINNRGQIVGYADWRATLFDASGSGNNKDLGTLGGNYGLARSINNSGQIVGAATNSSGSYRATLFDPTGGGNNIDLGSLPGYRDTEAYSISDSGQIVGNANTGGNDYRATLFDLSGDNIDLGTLGGQQSSAFSINDKGQIVGEAYNSSGDIRATLFDPTGAGNNIDLNTLTDPASGWTLVTARSINNSGWIAGQGFSPSSGHRALLMKPLPPRTYYVDADANGINDGSSWADAFNYLQDALAAAYSGDEIRVAQGIYKPDQGTNQTPGDRTATFQLKNGVAIKGGYAGEGTPDPNARDIQLYETILTGDLEGNDGPNFTHNDDNSYHVVTGNGTDKTAVFDGFIITAGNANHPWEALWRRGGGMYNSGGSPTLTNCKFGANSAVGGGAIYITGEFQGTFTDCVFENNAASKYGGAIYLTGTGELNIIRCEFRDGSAERGGAIYSYASLVLSQCILVNNQAKYAGAINTDGDITLTNCLLANNHALVWGGALSNMMNTSRSVNCTFVGNSANFGGAISSNIECDTIAINSIFWNNTAQTGSQIATSGSHGGSTLTVNYCDIENLLDGLYVPSGCTLNWGEDNINAEPLFADSDNGDYRLSASSPCVDVGDSNFIAEPNETDLDGKPRVLDGDNDGVLVVDMGAYEYRFTISAEARIIPKTINLASKGNWITSYIWLPEEYNVADIEPNSVFLDDEIQPEQFSVDEQQQIATARFSREKVQAILNVGDVELTITGQLTDGTVFEGTDTIKVIDKARKK